MKCQCGTIHDPGLGLTRCPDCGEEFSHSQMHRPEPIRRIAAFSGTVRGYREMAKAHADRLKPSKAGAAG